MPSQVFILMVAILLGRPAIEIPFTTKFDLESLDAIFQMSSTPPGLQSVRLCGDAAHVLLAMARVLMHSVRGLSKLRNSILHLIVHAF